MSDYTKILGTLSTDPALCKKLLSILDEEISLPNIPLPTMGGETFWTTFAECNGWKLQQNMITKHARILDQNSVRIAWGTINGMKKALDRLIEYSQNY